VIAIVEVSHPPEASGQVAAGRAAASHRPRSTRTSRGASTTSSTASRPFTGVGSASMTMRSPAGVVRISCSPGTRGDDEGHAFGVRPPVATAGSANGCADYMIVDPDMMIT
jgi:hypothetical protein